MREWDYVVVGSGAGGGTLAARLAEAGMRVFVIEAGGDPHDGAERLPEDYDVPGFHPFASENRAMSWEFFVRHYSDDKSQEADCKACPDPETGKPSVFYPRAGTLGGCTAHNAMIFMAPHESDWDEIASITGDASWRAPEMRRYFQLLENCRYCPLGRLLQRLGFNPTLHGWSGWLPAELALPRKAAEDDQLMRFLLETTCGFVRHSLLEPMASDLKRSWLSTAKEWLSPVLGFFLRNRLRLVHKVPWSEWIAGLPEGRDPNAQGRLRKRAEGLCFLPLTTHRYQRIGTRERLIEARDRLKEAGGRGELHIELNALATKVIFESDNRAVGVEYLKGGHLYRAHDRPSDEPGQRCEIRAREVILAGGAFNTPQLLMLSGIGPKEILEKHGIAVRVHLAGVGRNLQDRYEIAVIHKMAKPWGSLKDAKFNNQDPLYRQWFERRDGMYISNGAAIAFTKRSAPQLLDPDLFCMGLLTRFRGYYPGYSRDIPEHLDSVTFAILKAHTVNRAGYVTLRSNDPRDRPEINFRYFDDGDDREGRDIDAIVKGIKFVRKITADLKRHGLIGKEELPGEHLQTGKELAQHVRNTAWGHHASCTCPIGPPSQGGVLTSDFKVHGTQGLRVVDACVFPRIPGFFIVSAIYMIAEKAAEVILRDARR